MTTMQLFSLLLITATQLVTLVFVLYIIKSAMGINIFEHYSFGIWSWFKSVILNSTLVNNYMQGF